MAEDEILIVLCRRSSFGVLISKTDPVILDKTNLVFCPLNSQSYCV